jgi:hypothetical protein
MHYAKNMFEYFWTQFNNEIHLVFAVEYFVCSVQGISIIVTRNGNANANHVLLFFDILNMQLRRDAVMHPDKHASSYKFSWF